jgi:hypothetical protein
MKNEEATKSLRVVLKKVESNLIDEKNFDRIQVDAIVGDLKNLVEILDQDRWDLFDESVLDLIHLAIGKYFSKSELIGGFCPRVVSYKEFHDAQLALDSTAEYVRKKIASNRI